MLRQVRLIASLNVIPEMPEALSGIVCKTPAPVAIPDSRKRLPG
jgi:hypothetical protein